MGTAAQNGKDSDFFVTLKAGDYVYRESDEGDSMYIIEEGRIEILKQRNAEERKLADLEQGDFFGELTLLDDLPREASARASAESRLLRIDKATFAQMVRHNPEIGIRILRKLARRLRAFNASYELPQQPPVRPAEPPVAAATPAPVAPPVPIATPAPAAPAVRATTPAPAAPAVPSVPAAPPAPAAPSVPAAKPAPAPAAQVPVAPVAPRTFKLVSESTGKTILLPEKAEITVGRLDPTTGTSPDIDLTTEDTVRSVSRRHARLFRRDDGIFVSEEIGVANGTFVNNARIASGVMVPLLENDLVSFGRVVMAFRRN